MTEETETTPASGSPPVAVLDVGSNTIRLMVARVENGTVVPVLDRSEFVRLGKEVDSSGRLQPHRIAAAVEVIERLQAEARQAGAGSFWAIATSAVRDATNRQDLLDAVRRGSGVTIDVLSGEREAELTCRGAMLDLNPGGSVLVCDLGGGSAELIFARHGEVGWSTSQPYGSGRLSERFLASDPPGREAIGRLTSWLDRDLSRFPSEAADTAVLTGGTATNAALALGHEDQIVRLLAADLERLRDELAETPSPVVSERYGIRTERAEVLPAGVAALCTIIRHFRAGQVVVTRHGMREGALLERFGQDFPPLER